MNKIRRALLASIIFLAPTNFFISLSEQYSYVNGLRIDYLIPKLYLVSGLIALYLVINIFKTKKPLVWLKKLLNWLKKFPITSLLGSVLILVIVGQTIYTSPVSGGWYLAMLFLALMFAFSLQTSWQQVAASPLITAGFITTIIFQSAVGIFQFVNQQSVAGYYLLGEPNISRLLGLAKVVIEGKELVLPYGTTAHPNILGGFLAVYLLTIWLIIRKKTPVSPTQYFFTLAASICGMIALILTFSLSAWGVILIGGLLLIATNTQRLNNLLSAKLLAAMIIVVLAITPIAIRGLIAHNPNIPLLQNDSVFRRNYLNQAAIAMSKDHFISGVGLNSFSKFVEIYSPEREVVRFVQPVHHAGLLWLAETGLIGVVFLGLITLMLYQHRRGKTLLYAITIISPTLALDHYIFSLHSGMLLLVLLATITVPGLLANR